MTISPLLILRLKRNGIKMPVRTIQAANKAKLPLALACAILMQETGGGTNEWGHDPTIFVGGFDARHNKHWGETVTEDAYKAYLAQRGPDGRGGMQGVGPTQLTYFAYQDQADKIGGCWRPGVNMYVGFSIVAEHVRRDGLVAGVKAYNGTGPAADAYAKNVIAMMARFETSLKLKS